MVSKLLDENTANIEKAKSLTAGLSDVQMSWRPQPGKWSIAENLDHLNAGRGRDLDTIASSIAAARAKGIVGNGPFRYGWLSSWIMKSQEPPPKRKFKAAKAYAPSPDVDAAKALADYFGRTARLTELIQKADGLDLAVPESPPLSWDAQGRAYPRRIGYVPEEPHLYPHLTGREYLQLVGRLRGIARIPLDSKMDEFLRLFSLWDDRHSPLASYSKGMRQKILLSAALLHDPEVLILDEPFSGLDVTSALVLRRLLRALAEAGKMILYSSHVLEVVEKVCSQVLILRKGEVVAYDSITRLRELMSQPSLEGVFSQLAEVEDGEVLANRILAVMKS